MTTIDHRYDQKMQRILLHFERLTQTPRMTPEVTRMIEDVQAIRVLVANLYGEMVGLDIERDVAAYEDLEAIKQHRRQGHANGCEAECSTAKNKSPGIPGDLR